MRRFIGLMSGTSIDAVDAVLLETHRKAEADAWSMHTAGFTSISIDDALAASLHALQRPGPDELRRAAGAAQALADHYANAVEALLAQCGVSANQISAIGAHGQTVRHHPDNAYSLQLLDAARLAEHCRIPVVYDLRAADVAAGGQGAPLVPAFHAQVFSEPGEHRVIVNLGGIANISILPARTSLGPAAPCDALDVTTEAAASKTPGNTFGLLCEAVPDHAPEPVSGFDTGPANTLLDAWYRRHHNGPGFDEDGRWARSGTIDPELLARLLADPYFSRPAPKSTGRDHFHLDWLDEALADPASGTIPRHRDVTAHAEASGDEDDIIGRISSGTDQAEPSRPVTAERQAGASGSCGKLRPVDVQATLVELSARTIAQACRAAGAQAVYACGGGTRNSWLMERLRLLLAPIPLDTTDALGIAAQAVEAAAFAWLAMRRMDGRAGNLPAVTGARGPRVLGALADPF